MWLCSNGKLKLSFADAMIVTAMRQVTVTLTLLSELKLQRSAEYDSGYTQILPSRGESVRWSVLSWVRGKLFRPARVCASFYRNWLLLKYT